jgi:phosphopantetheinyl transferase
MEDLPEIKRQERIPVTIGIPGYLRDHVFRGRAVYPAVEAMGLLAGQALTAMPGVNVSTIEHADFTRFLEIGPGVSSVDAFTEIDAREDAVSARLITLKKSGKTPITRALEHVSLDFPVTRDNEPAPPLDVILGLEGICASPPPERIYEELVPFGPAYRNIERVHVSRGGAIALVSGGTGDAPDGPLGSPFPLDASFHAACVWGQRYAGIVGFPVHIDSRVIRKKTAAGATYAARVTPVSQDGGLLVFDAWIYDDAGDLCEIVRGLRMKDVSGGTILPPAWVRADDAGDPLGRIRPLCRDFSVLELDTLTPACAGILSEAERSRFSTMREKRARTFLGARMALKRLARRLPGADPGIPAAALTTMHDDGRPCCPLPDGTEPFFCTASHDSRFAVAAVSDARIGIDVEEISERVMNGRSLYMHEEELSLVKDHPIGEVAASTRVWSVKEAVSKALGITLAEAWQKARVTDIGDGQSAIKVDDTNEMAVHAVADGHLFTIVSLV